MFQGETNRLLGYPRDARLLIINADDFGMCQAVNDAVMRALNQGFLCSTTVMVPCPGAIQALNYLLDHPEVSFGIHLTVISEWPAYRWGPLTAHEKVPSLIDENGDFLNFDQMHANLALVELEQLEMEFRAQIEKVLATGLRPTHLDWHALRIDRRNEIFGLMVRLAQEYGLALRVRGSSWIETLQSQGLPTNDYDFLDSYLLDPVEKLAQYQQLLRNLPMGLNEWAVHPGLANAELRVIETSSHSRQVDYEFLMSSEAKAVVQEEGIILLDYRPLQAIWKEVSIQ